LLLFGFDEVDRLKPMVQSIELADPRTHVPRIIAELVCAARSAVGGRESSRVACRQRLFPIVEMIHWPSGFHATYARESVQPLAASARPSYTPHVTATRTECHGTPYRTTFA